MFKIFKNFTKRDLLYSLICVILITVHVGIELKIPDYMSEITRLVQTNGSSMFDILEQGFYMLLCAIGSLVSAIVVSFFATSQSAAKISGE